MDQDSARALVDAGYMPLRDYVAMFGDEVTAPSTVPDLNDMHAHDDHRPAQPSVISQLLDVLHHR